MYQLIKVNVHTNMPPLTLDEVTLIDANFQEATNIVVCLVLERWLILFVCGVKGQVDNFVFISGSVGFLFLCVRFSISDDQNI